VIRQDEKPNSGKKPYQKPGLRNYGRIAEITNATSNMGNRTDSRSPFNPDRTH
jgi:hypothetical protein